MFSEEDSSGDKIHIYIKLFLSAFNAFGKAVKRQTEERRIAAKNEETTFFSSSTIFFSLLNMPEMVRLHGSVKDIWEGINESYVITIMKKTDTYMPTLLTKLLQS